MDLINDECGGCGVDVNETSVVEVNTRLAPGDGRSRTTRDVHKQAQGATGTKADGLLQVVMELKVRSFCVRGGVGSFKTGCIVGDLGIYIYIS